MNSRVFTKLSNTNKIMLLLDGYSSHKNLKVAKGYGIRLPAHCTHRVNFLRSLQIYYNQEIQAWLRQNPGRIVT